MSEVCSCRKIATSFFPQLFQQQRCCLCVWYVWLVQLTLLRATYEERLQRMVPAQVKLVCCSLSHYENLTLVHILWSCAKYLMCIRPNLNISRSCRCSCYFCIEKQSRIFISCFFMFVEYCQHSWSVTVVMQSIILP